MSAQIAVGFHFSPGSQTLHKITRKEALVGIGIAVLFSVGYKRVFYRLLLFKDKREPAVLVLLKHRVLFSACFIQKADFLRAGDKALIQYSLFNGTRGKKRTRVLFLPVEKIFHTRPVHIAICRILHLILPFP